MPANTAAAQAAAACDPVKLGRMYRWVTRLLVQKPQQSEPNCFVERLVQHMGIGDNEQARAVCMRAMRLLEAAKDTLLSVGRRPDALAAAAVCLAVNAARCADGQPAISLPAAARAAGVSVKTIRRRYGELSRLLCVLGARLPWVRGCGQRASVCGRAPAGPAPGCRLPLTVVRLRC